MMSEAILVALGLLLMAGPTGEEITREAEEYDRFQKRLLPPEVFTRPAASQGRLVGVRGEETGYPTWIEYDFTVAGGLYELRLRAGGNDSRQAALLNVDGGQGVLVETSPSETLPPNTVLPADARQRQRVMENSFREILVGRLNLAAGRHRVRVTHAGMAGRSNAFALDWLKLVRVDQTAAPLLEVGNQPEPDPAMSEERIGPVVLRVLSSYRYWGPGEIPCYGVLLYNRAGPAELAGTLSVSIGTRSVFAQKLSLARGEAQTIRLAATDANAANMPPGRHLVYATFTMPGEYPLRDSAELIICDLRTPGWAKRAATAWVRVRFAIGSDLEAALQDVARLVDSGITCAVNPNVEDWLGEETITWPFRGEDEGWQRYLEGVHERGACLLMYHTMVTVSEHFYYEKRHFWEGRKPFHHCSWLSIYPDSPKWNQWQAADFQYALAQFPLDGIFLDNACATGAPGARTPKGEEAIARHHAGLRRAIKQANPAGILYSNYNTLTMDGLATVSAGWDAHMLEGRHPTPKQQCGQDAWTVEHFVTVASRVRQHTGKPFWPLMYTPDRYSGLGIACCAAARANPCGVVNPSFLHLLRDIREYLYADDVYLLPRESVAIRPADPDLAATAFVKLYPDGTRDWIIQIVNGTEEGGKLVQREVELNLDLPAADLRRPAWLLRPDADGAESIQLTNPMRLKVGVWTVLVIAEELLPRVWVQPTCLRPVPGESMPVSVTMREWTKGREPTAPSAVASIVSDSGMLEAKPLSAVNGVATLQLVAAPKLSPGNCEVSLRVRQGQRALEIPLLARVRPRFQVALHPSHFAVFPQGHPSGGKPQLRVTNHTQTSVRGELTLSAPEGWTIRPERLAYQLEPRQSKDLPVEISWPLFRPQGLYDLRDAELSCAGVEGLRSLPVRLHMPATWLTYCTMGTKPRDVIRNGANPGGGAPLSSIIMTVRGHPEQIEDARTALVEAIRRQKMGQQRVVVWFRTGGGQGSNQLADPGVRTMLAEFMGLGGGVILQENVFRDSPANRVLLQSDLCPVGEPYEALNETAGDWLVSDAESPAISRFASLVLEGKSAFRLPVEAQPLRVKVSVKPWARVVARNAARDPVVVVSSDPRRPIAYLGGSLEGTYIADRTGTEDYPQQMTQLLYFYAELARWLSIMNAD
jgi:hypothetical protein